MDPLQVLGAGARCCDHARRAAMTLFIAVLAMSPAHSQTLDGQELIAKRLIRLSSDREAPIVGKVEDVYESGRAVRTRVVIGSLLEGGVCRQTFYVFPRALDPSERDIVRIMQERPKLTALAVPRNGSCDDAKFFTLIGMAPSDGIRLIQSFLGKYNGLSWAPDGAGEVLFKKCRKAGLPLELQSLHVSAVQSEKAGKVFFSNLGDCRQGDISVSIRFRIGDDDQVSVWMVAVDDRLSNAIVD